MNHLKRFIIYSLIFKVITFKKAADQETFTNLTLVTEIDIFGTSLMK